MYCDFGLGMECEATTQDLGEASRRGSETSGYCSENPGWDSAMGVTRPPYPHDAQGVTLFAGDEAQTSARRSDHTDRPPEAGVGGRREGRHSAPRAPRGTGGDNTGYGAKSGPDCWASSGPQCINGLRPDTHTSIFIIPGAASAA